MVPAVFHRTRHRGWSRIQGNSGVVGQICLWGIVDTGTYLDIQVRLQAIWRTLRWNTDSYRPVTRPYSLDKSSSENNRRSNTVASSTIRRQLWSPPREFWTICIITTVYMVSHEGRPSRSIGRKYFCQENRWYAVSKSSVNLQACDVVLVLWIGI